MAALRSYSFYFDDIDYRVDVYASKKEEAYDRLVATAIQKPSVLNPYCRQIREILFDLRKLSEEEDDLYFSSTLPLDIASVVERYLRSIPVLADGVPIEPGVADVVFTGSYE